MWYIYPMEFYSAIRNNAMWLESKLKDIILIEVNQDKKYKGCMLSLIWKIDLKNKPIHKTRHDQI
jgi:hypothetical protein